MLFPAKSKQMALCYKEEHLRVAERRVPTCLLSAHVHVSGKIDDGTD